ncbi:MAG: ribosome maturation factor RimM [Gammaproteobacteria bacterium CG22_combo_CG10-13_8_21_14_all_40_8]|nr:MAG: ribosome maturation factor RimM [Gammaproteobacteria bacterium CG22_combo_CG10-13_8_21_14_all_40_8]
MSTTGEMQVIGKIGTAFGVKGWVKITSFTDSPEDIFKYSPWTLSTNQGAKAVDVVNWRIMSKGLVAQLAGCHDRDQALALRHVEISVALEQFEDLDDGDYYWKDLLDCRVMNLQKQDLGVVSKFMETGANDVLVLDLDEHSVPLKNSKGKKLTERLIPYVYEHVILEVDLDQKQIVVDWPSDF